MAEHHNEACSEVFDRVFNAAQGVIVDQIAGIPGHKKIPDVLIEDNLGRSARIGADHNNGERMLA